MQAGANYQKAIDLFTRLTSEHPKENAYRVKLLNYKAGQALLKLMQPAKNKDAEQKPNSNESEDK